MNKEKHDHPKVKLLKRGNRYRRCFMVQPYINSNPKLSSAPNVYRCALMELV